MKSHKLWIIFLIIYIKGTQTTLAPSTDLPAIFAISTEPSPCVPEDNCDCDYATQECTCDQLCGEINAPRNGSRDDPVVLNYTMSDEPSEIIVLRLNDFDKLSTSSCNIEFPDGQILGSGSNSPNIGDIYFTYFFTVTKKRECTWNMTYFRYPFEHDAINLTAMDDSIDPFDPFDPFIRDPNGVFKYRPNIHKHYILQTPEPGYTIYLNVSSQNLGVPFVEIHDEQAIKDATTGDLLLVGSGPNVLSGDETVLFGSNSMETTRMRIDADVAHVSFSYTSAKDDVDLHFNYSFTRTEDVTTMVPSTVPTTPTPPNENYFTFAAINCIEPQKEVAVELEPKVKTKIAQIATKYAEDDLDLTLDYNITDHEVPIYNIKKCNPMKCDPNNCVAYNFSILYINGDGNWTFTKETMDEMLLKYSEDFADLTTERQCGEEVCNEHPGVSMVPYIVLSVAAVLLGCIISFIVYKAGKGSVVREHKSKYKKENQERIEDERRRSSGNISMLGLGNTRGSLTSMSSSRKFSMPFPTKDKKPRKDVNYDVSGFKEFNPENSFGGEPVVLGLEKEFLGNPSSMRTYYSNEGFVPDEVVGNSRGRQNHWDNHEGSSSGSSSDVEDDGLSHPPLSQSHELAKRQLQEKLATIQASDSEGDSDSNQDVLFNRNPGTTVQLKPSVVSVDVHLDPTHEKETIL